MKKSLFFVAGLLISLTTSAQGPGGLRDSLRVWLKANTGITPTPLNTVPLWNELSGANLMGDFITNAPIGVAQLPPTYVPVGLNFNPHVAFDRTQPNSLASTNTVSGNRLFDPINNTIFQVIKIHATSTTGVWMKWQNSNQTSQRVGFEVDQATNPGQLRFDFATSNNSPTNVNDKYVLASFYTNAGQKGLYLNGALDFNVTTASNPTTCVGRLSLGNEPPAGVPTCFNQFVDPYPSTLDVAEIIWYKRALSAAERNKVESYLAIKYGFTLDQGATYANNYTSSNGTVIWNRTANLPFTNNITGIARDDSAALDQRQSRSVNTGATTTPLVTIYHGAYTGATTPASNVLNANTFTANNTFELFGDNGLTTTFTRCYSGGFLRMNRAWKAQQTGNPGTVTLAVNASDVPANTRHLIVGTDSAFTPGPNTVIYRLDINNSILSKSIVLPGPNAYFTFASDSLIAHPTSNSPLCQGDNLQLNSNIVLASYSWTGPAGFTSTAANPLITTVSAANSGYYVLNGGTAGCNIRTDSVKVTVNPRPAPPTIVTPIVYCMGDNALPLTAVGGNLKWYSQPVGGTGTTTPPIPNTAYEDTLTYWVTQAPQGCESIRSKQVVQIRFKPNGIILGTQSAICQGDIDTFYYYGNGRSSFVYDFHTLAFRTTLLSGSGIGPYIVRFDSAGTYPVRMQVNNDGCVGNDMFFYVTVRPSPAVGFLSKPDACVDEVVNLALFYTTSNVTHYTYDFAGGNIVYGTATGGPYGISWNTPGRKLIKLVATTTGCPSRLTYDTVNIHPTPDATFTATTTNICAGDSILFRARGTDSNTQYVWTPNYYFASGNIYESWGVVKAAGYVKLDVQSQYGCRSSDSLLITAKPCCELYFPNVFSPNNDQKNDVFKVVTVGHHQIANFRIVNRWGQTVFETKDERAGWDGTYNGKAQDVGTYYYYIKYQCPESPDYQEQKGELLLIR